MKNPSQIADTEQAARTSDTLDQQRKLAVQLRLDGHTIEQTREKCGLSAPTIISAYKAYLSGGWNAVVTKPRGRQIGATSLTNDQQVQLKQQLLKTAPEQHNSAHSLWSYPLGQQWLASLGHKLSIRAATRYLQDWGFKGQHALDRRQTSVNPALEAWVKGPYEATLAELKRSAIPSYWIGLNSQSKQTTIYAYSGKKQFFWMASSAAPSADACIEFADRLQRLNNGPCHLFIADIDLSRAKKVSDWLTAQPELTYTQVPFEPAPAQTTDQHAPPEINKIQTESKSMTPHIDHATQGPTGNSVADDSLTHIQQLEAESIAIIREVVAESENPAMLYSLGKDSAVMLHLAIKAFYPAPPPFPLVHIDTTWKFRAMYEHRDQLAKDTGLELLIHTNPEGLAQGVNPFSHGSALHTEIMKTEALKQAINKYRFDTALVGSRRDEEKSRAKERIFSFRNAQHRWDPKNQRPELWQLYNTRKNPGESFRAYPLSNWTEFDIWHYIHKEQLTVLPLYYAAERPIVERDGALIVVDDERMPLHEGEVPVIKQVRFRSVGCYPLTAAFESAAMSTDSILKELIVNKTSERRGRMIDHDSTTSLEKKKQDGYF